MRILVDAARRTNERCKVFVAFAAKTLFRTHYNKTDNFRGASLVPHTPGRECDTGALPQRERNG